MGNEQMIKDINNWSRDKLQQWFEDSMTRYKLCDCGYSDALSHTMSTLIMAAAGGLALQTHIPVREAAVTFGKLILEMRQESKKEYEDEC